MLRLIILLSLVSCSLLPENSRKRKIQTEVVRTLTDRAPELSKCISENDLFEKFQTDRIRILVYLTINSKGQVEKFKLDEQKYPNEFSECIFQKIDSVSYPKIKEHEVLNLEQPFIFSKEQ